MSAVPEAQDLVTILVQKTKSAQQNRNVLHQPPHGPHLSGNGTELWGGEAALDFLEFHWKTISKFLIASAESRKVQAQLTLPTMGPRAMTQAKGYFEKTLHGCKISAHGSTMAIDWSDPVRSS